MMAADDGGEWAENGAENETHNFSGDSEKIWANP
jgi:hypothetical protein